MTGLENSVGNIVEVGLKTMWLPLVFLAVAIGWAFARFLYSYRK